jgi:hypothetical protein
MRVSIRSSTLSRITGAVAALWLYGAGAAWAGGGGGEDLAGINTLISGTNGLCQLFKYLINCPAPLPTETQGVLEVVALENNLPEIVGAQNNIPAGSRLPAGSPAIDSSTLPVDSNTGLPILPSASTTPSTLGVLATLTPLAFISGSKATGPTVSLVTSSSTAAGDTTLNFATTKGLIANQAYSIVDATPGNTGAIPPGTILSSFIPPATTVTMSANATGSGVASGDKITFTPIANPAAATQLADPNADAFLYAVGVGPTLKTLPVPGMVYFFYDDLLGTNQNFNKGQIVGRFSFPLTQLDSNSSRGETTVMTTIQVVATCKGGLSCLQAQVGGTPVSPGIIGFAPVFGPSPALAKNHVIFEFAIPLLVTDATDPAYFYTFNSSGHSAPNPINQGTKTVFQGDQAAAGLAPSAGPLGPSPTCTPTISGGSCTPPLSTFALCADLPDNTPGPPGNDLPHAVGAYYAVATSGETWLSAPLPAASTSMCPSLAH